MLSTKVNNGYNQVNIYYKYLPYYARRLFIGDDLEDSTESQIEINALPLLVDMKFRDKPKRKIII